MYLSLSDILYIFITFFCLYLTPIWTLWQGLFSVLIHFYIQEHRIMSGTWWVLKKKIVSWMNLSIRNNQNFACLLFFFFPSLPILPLRLHPRLRLIQFSFYCRVIPCLIRLDTSKIPNICWIFRKICKYCSLCQYYLLPELSDKSEYQKWQ